MEKRLNRGVNCDSVVFVKKRSPFKDLGREHIKQGLALFALLALAALAIAGPTGLLAWSESDRLLELRQAQLAELTRQRDELRNRVALLDPDGADPDLVSEYIRRNLNLVREDEVLLNLEEDPR